jgi:hypothetical protein
MHFCKLTQLGAVLGQLNALPFYGLAQVRGYTLCTTSPCVFSLGLGARLCERELDGDQGSGGGGDAKGLVRLADVVVWAQSEDYFGVGCSRFGL